MAEERAKVRCLCLFLKSAVARHMAGRVHMPLDSILAMYHHPDKRQRCCGADECGFSDTAKVQFRYEVVGRRKTVLACCGMV
jgi:hypothetical protein